MWPRNGLRLETGKRETGLSDRRRATKMMARKRADNKLSCIVVGILIRWRRVIISECMRMIHHSSIVELVCVTNCV